MRSKAGTSRKSLEPGTVFGLRRLAAFSLLLLLLAPACNLMAATQATPEPTGFGAQAAATLTAAAAVLAPPAAPSETGAPATGAPGAESTPAAPGVDGGATQAPPAQEHSAPALLLAYLSSGDIWAWDEAAGARQLTRFGDVSTLTISGDGQRIAFQRQISDNEVELWVVDAAGGNPRVLEDVPALKDMDPGALGVAPNQVEWIPGTHVLAYNTRQLLQGPGAVQYNDLRLVDADNLEHSTLLAPGDGGMFYYSPDAGRIAVVTSEKIFLMNSDGSDRLEVLSYTPVLTYSEYAYYAKPVWAPDGSHLRVAIPPSDPLSNPAQPTGLWYIPAEGGAAQQVGSVVANMFSGSEPFFSPALDRIAYIRRTGAPESNQYELHLAAPDGSDDTVYTSGGNLFFDSWTDEAGRFIYNQQSEGGPVYYLGSLGAEPAALSGQGPALPGQGPGIASLKWLGEGKYLVLTGSYASQSWSLLFGEEGAEPVKVADMQGALPGFEGVVIR